MFRIWTVQNKPWRNAVNDVDSPDRLLVVIAIIGILAPFCSPHWRARGRPPRKLPEQPQAVGALSVLHRIARWILPPHAGHLSGFREELLGVHMRDVFPEYRPMQKSLNAGDSGSELSPWGSMIQDIDSGFQHTLVD